MKIVALIVRLLLGLMFLVFGLNAFLQFRKGPIPGGLAG
jgi:putative oxidoreductase